MIDSSPDFSKTRTEFHSDVVFEKPFFGSRAAGELKSVVEKGKGDSQIGDDL